MIQNFSRYQCFPTVGKIYDKKKKRFVEGCEHPSGYIIVSLQDDNGNWKMMLFHRVILMAYMGEGIPDGLEVNHLDECKTNNQIRNLNLMTHKDNCNFGTRNERVGKASGKARTNNPKVIAALTNNPKKSKRVQAFNTQGNLVYDFPSAMEAERQGFNNSNIIKCCNGKRKTHKGLIWKYT